MYESSYVIVAGIAWIRRSRVETSSGRVDDTAWVVTFDGDEPVARRSSEPGALSLRRGFIGDLDWELDWVGLAPAFETPRPQLRRLSPNHMLTVPAILAGGRIGERTFEAAPGHTARLRGKRHTATWGWSHASTADGSWVQLLTASVPPVMRVSQHGRDGRPPRLPFARASVDPPQVRVGPYVADAPAERFIGLRYLHTDGSPVWCYHSEQGHLGGDGVDLHGAALEVATREPIDGWRVEPS